MKDLLKLYSFESVHETEGEEKIFKWICKWLDLHGVKYQTMGKNIYHLTEDSDNVIFSAHLDQVKTNGPAKYFRRCGGIIKGYNEKWERTSLGADDKNGVWCILKLLEMGCDIDFIISEGEEKGCIGISALENNGVLDVIDSSRICIVLDRRGNTDILRGGGGDTYCSTLAQDLCNFFGKDYKVTTGSLSDTAHLCLFCESVNMSTCYDSPHTAKETTDICRLYELLDDLDNMLINFVHYSTDPAIYLSTYKTGKTNNTTKVGEDRWYGYWGY